MRRRWSDLNLYLRQVGEARRKRDCAGVLDLIRDFAAWRRSQGRSGLDDAHPWITFEATRRIEHLLTAESKVFEYGTGGSTLFLARRVARVVSVENDPAWFEVVRDRLGDDPKVEVLLVPGEPASSPDDEMFSSRSALYSHLTFQKYVQTIDRFPDDYFDLLLIDGRARPSAFFEGHRKVRIGGAIILDDSNRSGYAAAVEAATGAGWPAFGHIGPKPYTPGFVKTTVWTKTSAMAARTT